MRGPQPERGGRRRNDLAARARRCELGFTRQRLGAENIDIDRNYGLEVLGIPGTNGPDRLQGGYPRFVINGFSSIGNPNVSNPFQFRDNQYVAVGNLSWMKGSHWLRFGGEYTYSDQPFQPGRVPGPRGAHVPEADGGARRRRPTL